MTILSKSESRLEMKPANQVKPIQTPLAQATNGHVKIRPLEREDLRFVHDLDNNELVMHYWFEEPYEAFVELCDLYDKHIHDQSERRFIVEHGGERVGLVELVEINHIHRRAEFQIIIAPEHQGKGYASAATVLAIEYAFFVLNLYKQFLVVDCDNHAALRVYRKLGFRDEGVLRHEFFVNGEYRDALRMALFQPEFLVQRKNANAGEVRNDLP